VQRPAWFKTALIMPHPSFRQLFFVLVLMLTVCRCSSFGDKHRRERRKREISYHSSAACVEIFWESTRERHPIPPFISNQSNLDETERRH
jgi:hypothetical protein